MKKELPKDLDEKINALATSAWTEWQKGDSSIAEASFLKAWDLIPDPKFEYDLYPQALSRRIAVFYRDSKQDSKALEWLDIVKQAYSPLNDASLATITFLEATVDFDAGRLDQAFSKFESLYKEYGKRPFEGAEKRFCDFFFQRL